MNIQKRLAVLAAIQTIAAEFTDPNAILHWQVNGADPDSHSCKDLEFYANDEYFADTLHAFLEACKKSVDGDGIVIDGVSIY